MRRWGFAGIAVACGLALVSQARGQEQTDPPRIVDYWIGDMPVTGETRKDAGVNLSGNNLNFDLGRADPINASARFKVWLHEDGIPRLQIGQCVTALRPAKPGVTFESGGGFVPDYAYVGTPVNCGLSPGEVILERTDTLTPTAEGIRYTYKAVNKIVQPYAGKATINGEALLRPVYKPIPKPAPPPPPPVTVAAAPAPVPAPVAAPPAVRQVVDRAPITTIPKDGKRTWNLTLRLSDIDNMGAVFISDLQENKRKLVMACSWIPGIAGSGSIGFDSMLNAGFYWVTVFVFDQETSGLSSFLTAGKWTYRISLSDKDGPLWSTSDRGVTDVAGVKYAREFLLQRREDGGIYVYPTAEIPASARSTATPMELTYKLFGNSTEEFADWFANANFGGGAYRSDFLGAGRTNNFQDVGNCG